MNFRNKDLTQVFDERYRANHNEKLLKEISDNKKNTTDRMFGSNNQNKTIFSENRKVIGYNDISRK